MTAHTAPDAASVPKRSTRDQLLAAATELFRTRGFEATSIEAIGAAAGVRGPALYYHFGSKAALLYECLAAPLRSLLQAGRAAVKDKPPLQAVLVFTVQHVLFQLNHFAWPEAHRGAMVATGALIQSLPEQHQRELYRLERKHLDTLRTAVSAGVASGEIRDVPVTPAAFAMIGMSDQVITWYREDAGMSAEDVATLYADMAVRMVSSRPSRA
jgi:AcrR family transcriptional regulator